MGHRSYCGSHIEHAGGASASPVFHLSSPNTEPRVLSGRLSWGLSWAGLVVRRCRYAIFPAALGADQVLAEIGQVGRLWHRVATLQERGRAHHDNALRALAANHHGKAIVYGIAQRKDRRPPSLNPAVFQGGYWEQMWFG